MTAIKRTLETAPIKLEAEKLTREIENLPPLTVEGEAKFLNAQAILYQMIIEQITRWARSYLNRESGFIKIENELHPVDEPHPLLINHPAYKELVKKNGRLRRVQLIMGSIAPDYSK